MFCKRSHPFSFADEFSFPTWAIYAMCVSCPQMQPPTNNIWLIVQIIKFLITHFFFHFLLFSQNQFGLNFSAVVNFISYCCSRILEFCHIFERFFNSLCAILSSRLAEQETGKYQAAAYFRRTVAELPPRPSGFNPSSDHVGFVWGRFSPSTSVSPANSYSTNYSILINHPVIDDRVLILENVVKYKQTTKGKPDEYRWRFISGKIGLKWQAL
jgi:hypothetical protein